MVGKRIGNPSKTKLNRYILLKILNAYFEEGIDFKKLQELSNIEPKDLIRAIDILLHFRCMKKSKDKYIPNNNSRKLLKYYEEIYGARDWYKFLTEQQRNTLDRLDSYSNTD